MSQSNKLRCLFWNARSLRKCKQELPSLLQDLDIFICVESWLQADSAENFNFAGFLTYRKDRLHAGGGGILLLVRKSIGYIEINDVTPPDRSVEMTGIKITNLMPAIGIIVCYRTPDRNLNQQQWDSIISHSQKLEYCIMVGDFNAHNKSWNCDKTDSNGEKLLNSIENHDLFIHNVNSKTYVNAHQTKKSNLDLIISSINLADKINYTVSDDTLGSDHFPINFTIDTVGGCGEVNDEHLFCINIMTGLLSYGASPRRVRVVARSAYKARERV